MDDERTIYDGQQQATACRQPQAEEHIKGQGAPSFGKGKTKKKPVWHRVATGTGMGFALGAATTLLSSSTSTESVGEEPGNSTDSSNENGTPVWVDDEVNIASSVNDDMTFNEAFQAARTEVGTGGVFEWHGQVYNTFYTDEWDQMTAEERTEYESHFNWNNHHSEDIINVDAEDEDVDVVTVEVSDGIAGTEDDDIVPVAISEDEADVQILGVVHDDSTGVNVGGMLIDGHEAVVLDIDGDMQFDMMGIDLNDDHHMEAGEFADISDESLTVDDMGGLTPMDDLQAADDFDTNPDIYDC